MAEKSVILNIKINGTEEQKKGLRSLQSEMDKLTKERQKLNKAEKDGLVTAQDASRRRADLNLQIRATRLNINALSRDMLGQTTFAEKLGGQFTKLGNTISGAFIGVFAAQKLFAVVSDGIKTIREFEQQMANVKAITGATDEEFQMLTKSAKSLGATTQFTATEVGKLQEEFAKLGFSTQEILDATEATLDLAVATGSDLAQSAVVAASTLKGFGLDAKETKRVVDVMAKSFTSSALDINKFETAMASVAPVASAVGLSVEETTASLGVLVDAGFDASTAGTALRNILLDTQQAGISLSEAFNKIRNSTDPATTAMELFDKRGAAVALTLAKNETRTESFARSLDMASGSAKAMANIVGDTLEGDLKRLSSAWEGLILNFSDSDALRSVVNLTSSLVTGVSDLTKNIHEESDAMEEQRIQINSLVLRITNLNEGTDERKKLLQELNVISPTFLKGLDLETVKNEQLSKRLQEVNKELVNNILIKQEEEKINAQAEEQADAARELIETEIELTRKLDEVRSKAQKNVEKNIGGQEFVKRQQKIIDLYNDANLPLKERAFLIGQIVNEQTGLFNTTIEELLSKYTKAQKSLNEEDLVANELVNNKTELLKRLGVSLDETAEKTEEVNKVPLDILGGLEEGLEDGLEEKIKKATEKLLEEVQKLKDEAIVLDIDNTREAEDEKLRLERERALESVRLSKATAEAKGQAEQAINAKYDALERKTQKERQEEDLQTLIELEKQADQFQAERLKEEEEKNKDLEKEKLEQKREIREAEIQFAVDTATQLLNVAQSKADREKDIELANLDAQVQQGTITQEEFEKKKLEIEKKAFEKKKKLELANIAISLAQEIASINAAAAANPLNAVTFGAAGLTQAQILTGIAVARSAIQAGVVASQSFAEGGYTGSGFGSPDATGYKQAGVVHENEYVVPEKVLQTPRGSKLVNQLESMRLSRPNPKLGIGFAGGGFTSPSQFDLSDMENRISKAVVNSIKYIPIVNNATNTAKVANQVINIQSEATFG